MLIQQNTAILQRLSEQERLAWDQAEEIRQLREQTVEQGGEIRQLRDQTVEQGEEIRQLREQTIEQSDEHAKQGLQMSRQEDMIFELQGEISQLRTTLDQTLNGDALEAETTLNQEIGSPQNIGSDLELCRRPAMHECLVFM